MRYPRSLVLLSLALATIAHPARSQSDRGMMGGSMMGGAMMGHDSTSSAIMRVVHQLVTNHDKLRRTVTVLPNGVRTVTESDDSAMVQQLKAHVAATGALMAAGTDPNLPMSSPSLHGVLQSGTRITRVTEETARGVIVTETSDDSAAVALLHQHAAEVTDLVNRGMEAMRETMMKSRGMSHESPRPASVEPASVEPAASEPPSASAREHVHTPGMSHDSGAPAERALPTRPGQEAFATIGEIVRLLDADPRTDWSTVDLEALRQHLIDMDDVTMRATVRTESVTGGANFDVQGAGRVRDAIRRMALSHGATISAADGFSWMAAETPQGARVSVRALDPSDAKMVARLRALGFIGILTLGDHHVAHHLGIADGSMRGSHQHR